MQRIRNLLDFHKNILYFLFVMMVCKANLLMGQPSSIHDKLNDYYRTLRPEEAVIHIDRNSYEPGDRIWYKVYVKSFSNDRQNLSQVVYVELLSSTGEILLRQKLRASDGSAFGDILLPTAIKSDDYRLRTYTLSMLNSETSSFAAKIISIRTKIDPTIPSANAKQSEFIKAVREKNDTVVIALDDNVVGKLIAHADGRMLLEQQILANKNASIILPGRPGFQNIYFGLFSREEELLYSSRVLVGPSDKNFLQVTNRARYKPRSKVVLDLKLVSMDEKNLSGNFSISVRKKSPSNIANNELTLSEQGSWKSVMNFSGQRKYPKESTIYPPASKSLDPIPFVDTPGTENLPTTPTKNILKSVEHAYGSDSIPVLRNYLKLPSDIKYFVSDFQQLPTIEMFIKELVPYIKLKNKSGRKTMHIRNLVGNRIYFYASDPLMIVNNHIVSNVEEVLNMSPSKFETVEVTWKPETLSKTGISGALASYGVLALYSKLDEQEMTEGDIYKSFHYPAVFVPTAKPINTSEDVIPVFRELVYWNPNVDIRERSSVSFYLPDDLGEFEIEVIGLTTDGNVLKAVSQYIVEF
jgi:hypothetical protein